LPHLGAFPIRSADEAKGEALHAAKAAAAAKGGGDKNK
jgi:hypothetical protein